MVWKLPSSPLLLRISSRVGSRSPQGQFTQPVEPHAHRYRLALAVLPCNHQTCLVLRDELNSSWPYINMRSVLPNSDPFTELALLSQLITQRLIHLAILLVFQVIYMLDG